MEEKLDDTKTLILAQSRQMETPSKRKKSFVTEKPTPAPSQRKLNI